MALQSRWGSYKLVRPLGAGGVGAAHLTQEWPSNQRIVLKEIVPDLLKDPHVLTFLREEVDKAKTLDDPGILKTLGMPDIDGRIVLLREYVEGVNLSSFLALVDQKKLLLTREMTSHIIHSLVLALSAVHAIGPHGRVHGQNVFFRSDGTVVLSDPMVGNDWLRRRLVKQTMSSEELKWLWPEALSRGEISTRSDVFGLGFILHALAKRMEPESGAVVQSLSEACTLGDPSARPTEVNQISQQLRQMWPSVQTERGKDAVALLQPQEQPQGPMQLAKAASFSNAPDTAGVTQAVTRPVAWDQTIACNFTFEKQKKRRALTLGLVVAAFLLGLGVSVGWQKAFSVKRGGWDAKSYPAGADLSVLASEDGGKQVFLGRTPCQIQSLESGKTYVIKVNREGFLPYERSLKVEDPQSMPPLNISLEVLLRPRISPANARVSIRGGPIEQWSPISEERTLTAGKYELKIEAPGFETMTEEMDLSEITSGDRPGGIGDVSRTLLHAVPLTVWPSESSVEVPENGKMEEGRLLLPVGSHSILAKCEGFKPLLCALEVTDAGEILGSGLEQTPVGGLVLRLEKELQIVTTPADADVVVTSDEGGGLLLKGRTPLVAKGVLAGKTYTVSVSKWGFSDSRKVVAPERISGSLLEIALQSRPRPQVSMDAQNAFSSLALQNVSVLAEKDGGSARWNFPVQQEVEPGTYRLRVSALGHETAEKDVVVGWEPASQSIKIPLIPWPVLVFRAERLDGTPLTGATFQLSPGQIETQGPWNAGERVTVRPGRYTVEALCLGYASGVASFDVQPAPSPKEVKVVLKPTGLCQVELGTLTRECEVRVESEDGTPITLSKALRMASNLQPGPYTIVSVDSKTGGVQKVSLELGDPNRSLRVHVMEDFLRLEWQP